MTKLMTKSLDSIADISSYYFPNQEEYRRVKNLNSEELKLWLIQKVLEDEIEVTLFFQEEA